MQALITVRYSNKTSLKCYVINPFQANASFPYFPPTPQKKHQKFKGFFIVAGGIRYKPYPSPAFSRSTLPGWYPGNSLFCHSPKYVRMSALSESRRGRCISYLDFLINTDRILFPQEDIRNDPHVI